LRGGSKGASLACLRREPYRKPNKDPKSAPNAPRPPRSRRSTLLTHPGLTDSTQAGLVPVRPDTLQDRLARLRFSACATAPGRPQDHLPARAHSAADLSPVLAASAARMSSRPGDFCRVTPFARKRPTKMASWLPAVTLLITSVAARKPDHGTGFGKGDHEVAERAAMFAQMRFCMDYCTEPATGSTSPRALIDGAHHPRN
jgi:hypothetical protein